MIFFFVGLLFEMLDQRALQVRHSPSESLKDDVRTVSVSVVNGLWLIKCRHVQSL